MSQSIIITSNETANSSSKLSVLLANTYLLYLKTQNYHWNIVDKSFISLHQFLENQYQELAEAVDTIAERIRVLDNIAPATFAEFLQLATLSEQDKARNSSEMLTNLVKDHNLISKDIRGYINEMQDTNSNDHGTIDFFTNRLKAHEQAVWMLKSHMTSG
ncbi:MAG: DNA starvation/stationary phase protection protein [Rickettsiaceae bacterium]|nr:MAG: DNA starvation/stationary phase protection protein [Rickettsiaceae bacterium]